jgi:hypothetical protein
MEKLPLYHETAKAGHGAIPVWWFGAPFLAFVYAFVTPRLLPEIVSIPEALPRAAATGIRWLIGLVLGAALISRWRFVWWAARRAG